jgi:Tol biopolymer transport system component
VAGVAIGLLIALFAAFAGLADVSPSPGSERIPSTADIRIRFRVPVDKDSVEEGLQILPEREGDLTWEGRMVVFRPQEPWPAGGEVTVKLSPGVRLFGFLPLLRGRSWTLNVDVLRVMYLWPSWDDADIYLTDLTGLNPQRLTETQYGVIDYALDQAGERVYYAALRVDGGNDLRVLDVSKDEDQVLFACPEQTRCSALALQPDGGFLAFERRDHVVGAAGRPIAQPVALWVLPLDREGEPFPVGDSSVSASSPMWSPQGWLAYYDENLRAVALLEDVAGTMQPANYIPNDLGLLGSWSPDGSALALVGMLVREQTRVDEIAYYSHIYNVQLRSGHAVDLSAVSADLVEDASPAYAPNGAWIAFSRRSLQEDLWTLGRQLWLMRPDGTQVAALSNAPIYNHASIHWASDSNHVVYLRKNQSDLAQPPQVWWMNIEHGQQGHLVEGSYLPRWMP